MDVWAINLILAFLISAFLSGVMIPQILLISFRKKLFDVPDERKIHKTLVPRLGGLAFKPVIFFTIAFIIGVNILLGNNGIISQISANNTELTFVYCAIMMLYVIGVADDLIGVRYRAKFVAQIICGLMFIAGGVSLFTLDGVLGLHQLPVWFSWFATVFLVVFISNAINLIDGIDGLCSGLCSVVLGFYGLVFAFLGEYIYSLLSFSTLGVLIPFFYYNVFGDAEHNRKIFMGDTGSLTIGIIISFLSIKISQLPETSLYSGSNLFVLSFAPLIVPCFDVIRVFLHRIREHKSPFLPDKNHIHHKFLAIGLPQRKAMITIILVSIIFTVVNVFLSFMINVNILLLINIIVWTAGHLWLTKKIKKIRASV